MRHQGLAFAAAAAAVVAVAWPNWTAVHAADSPTWRVRAAAAYLDTRQDEWQRWPSAARDHDTACVSCHSALPYALARPALRATLNERGPSPGESRLFADVVKRVRSWNEMEPWYPDQTRGLPKTSESRGTESVINAVVLARRDADAGVLSTEGRQALSHMWAQQMRTGELSGAWAWLSFRLEPWEGAQSAYFGAALAAVAVGTAPANYAANAEIQKSVELLRGYLTRNAAAQHTLNKMMLLWAASRLHGLLTPAAREALMADVLAAQQRDGGWSTALLGPWQRADGTALDTASDGYATGLATFALQQSGLSSTDARVARGLGWLTAHQDKATGRWSAVSLNKQRDAQTEAAKFMNDVATAYAVLALTAVR